MNRIHLSRNPLIFHSCAASFAGGWRMKFNELLIGSGVVGHKSSWDYRTQLRTLLKSRHMPRRLEFGDTTDYKFTNLLHEEFGRALLASEGAYPGTALEDRGSVNRNNVVFQDELILSTARLEELACRGS